MREKLLIFFNITILKHLFKTVYSKKSSGSNNFRDGYQIFDN